MTSFAPVFRKDIIKTTKLWIGYKVYCGTPVPVSYTHLDVYKRQVPQRFIHFHGRNCTSQILLLIHRRYIPVPVKIIIHMAIQRKLSAKFMCHIQSCLLYTSYRVQQMAFRLCKLSFFLLLFLYYQSTKLHDYFSLTA